MGINGFGAEFAFMLGVILSEIKIRIILLYERLDKEIQADSMGQNINFIFEEYLDKGKTKKKKKKLNIEELTEFIEEINSTIELLNKELLSSGIFKIRIEILNKSKILDLYKKRFNKECSNEESLQLTNENFRLLISSEINNIINSIEKFRNQFESKKKFPDFENVDVPYKEEVREAINILSFGYGKTAVLCIGRAIEDLINKYLIKLFEKNKISKEDYERIISSKYNNRIGFLKGRFMTEEEFTDLNSFAFKRDKGGHLNLGEINNNEAKIFIQQGIIIILKFQDKIKKIKSEREIEEEKSREILGGGTNAGQPILYGTPKEKLKQLEGYGGKSIDEIRRGLLQEIEEENKSK